jgi:DUF1009 family protein
MKVLVVNDVAGHKIDSRKIGLLAGWGRYPIVVAEALKQQGYSVYCVGLKDHTDPVLRQLCDDYQDVGMGKLGAAIRFFRRRGVTAATMAGKIHKVRLFEPMFILRHFPDWRGLRAFYPHFFSGKKDRKDDTLLGAIVAAFADDGIVFIPATDFAPELLVKFGTLTRRRLSRAEQRDIQFGWQIAKEIGRLDIGQSVVIKHQAVMAIEAVEGTDQCIRRAGQLCRSGGFTVVKVAKPQQDMRFDVPTIGLGTLQTLAESGGRVLAVEAGKTILIDEPEVIEFANRHNLTVVAIDEASLSSLSDAA